MTEIEILLENTDDLWDTRGGTELFRWCGRTSYYDNDDLEIAACGAYGPQGTHDCAFCKKLRNAWVRATNKVAINYCLKHKVLPHPDCITAMQEDISSKERVKKNWDNIAAALRKGEYNHRLEDMNNYGS